MKPFQVESWALEIIDRVEVSQPIEDFRVELKSDWIPPEKAARRIAGHANASRGAPILWLIGIDEKRGIVTGATHEDLADWYAKVKAQFDGWAPQLTDLNIPVGEKTVVALLFETERIPFVVKNPAFGKEGGGPVELEVPWREGTSTRSATRADLLKLLSPLQALPVFEVISGTLVAKYIDGGSNLRWSLKLELYADTSSEDRIVIPFHRCKATCKVLTRSGGRMTFDEIRLTPPYSAFPGRLSQELLSETITNTQDEVLIYGPGKLRLYASLTTPSMMVDPVSDAEVAVHLLPTNAEHPVPISVTLPWCEPEKNEAHRWVFMSTS